MPAVKLTHPDLPDSEVVVTEKQAAVMKKSGWKRKTTRRSTQSADDKPSPVESD
jgi:hypothetical protein